MLIFNGSVKLVQDTPRTIQELIQLAIAARTYDADNAKNAKIVAQEQSRWQGVQAEISIRPQSSIWIIDGYKGVGLDGKAKAASWALVDFTLEPGGGELILAVGEKDLASGYHANAIALGQRVVWSDGADAIIYLDVSKR